MNFSFRWIVLLPIFTGCVRESPSPAASVLRAASIHDSAVVIDHDSTRLRVEKRSGANLDAEAGLLRQNVFALYAPAVAPYPGSITNRLGCGDRFMYKEIFEKAGDLEFRGFKLYANGRYVMGVCHESEVRFTAYRGLIICPAGELFEIHFFEPYGTATSRFEQSLLSLKCPVTGR